MKKYSSKKKNSNRNHKELAEALGYHISLHTQTSFSGGKYESDALKQLVSGILKLKFLTRESRRV